MIYFKKLCKPKQTPSQNLKNLPLIHSFRHLNRTLYTFCRRLEWLEITWRAGYLPRKSYDYVNAKLSVRNYIFCITLHIIQEYIANSPPTRSVYNNNTRSLWFPGINLHITGTKLTTQLFTTNICEHNKLIVVCTSVRNSSNKRPIN